MAKKTQQQIREENRRRIEEAKKWIAWWFSLRQESPFWPESQLDTILINRWEDISEDEFWTPPEPTVATTTTPIVDRDEVTVTPPAAPVTTWIAEEEFWVSWAPQKTLAELQIESDIEAQKKREAEQLVVSWDVFAEELARETERIRAAWKRTQDTLSRALALRWGLRGTAWEQKLVAGQEKVNALISTAERKADLELQLRDAKIKWVSWEALDTLSNNLNTLKATLAEQTQDNIQTQLEVAWEIWWDFIENVLSILSTTWEDVDSIDRAKSGQANYLVKKDWTIYLDANWKPVSLKAWWTGEYSALDIDNFATWISSWKFKPSDLKLDADTYSQVIAAMNAKSTDKPWLSINRIKAQRILKDVWLWVDAESTQTVTNLLKTLSEQEVRDMISTDEFQQASFVAWNQKLFDDLRKDSQSFKDIDRTFKWMNTIWGDFKDNPSESRAAMEQALIIMFNKMLDPGSVVREWEFDRTSQWQSVMNSAEWYLQKLMAGWAWIKNEAFEDIVNIAKVLHDASQDTVWDIKTSYRSFAWDLWADPEFVDRFFEVWFDLEDTWTTFTWESSLEDITSDLFWEEEEWATFTWATIQSDEDVSSFLDN